MKHPHGIPSICIVPRAPVHLDFWEIDIRANDVVYQICEEVFGHHRHNLDDLTVGETCIANSVEIDVGYLTTRFSHTAGKS